MNDKEFKQMIAELVTQEEQRLQVNSQEFNQRHEELMEMLQRAGSKEWGIIARIPSGMRKKENGLFEKRFTVNGKRYSAYGHNVKECADNEIRLREEIKAGIYSSNNNITLDTYFNEWEKSRIGIVKDSSIKTIRSRYDNHIKPVF